MNWKVSNALKFDTYRGDVYEQMDLFNLNVWCLGVPRGTHREHHEEERSEVVKHLGEKVPPHPRIRSEVRKQQPAVWKFPRVSEGASGLSTHCAPHVCGTHAQPPETSVEARVSAIEYTMNSASRGSVLRRFAEKGLGEARLDTGLPMSSNRRGATSKMEDSESCSRKDSARRQQEDLPVTVLAKPLIYKWNAHLCTRTLQRAGRECYQMLKLTTQGWVERHMDSGGT